MTTTAIAAATAAIDALGFLHNNDTSTRDKELALRAISAGRPAFWSNAGYSNTVARILLEEANRTSLADALALATTNGTDGPRDLAVLLASLIPLNPQAVAEIARVRNEWAR